MGLAISAEEYCCCSSGEKSDKLFQNVMNQPNAINYRDNSGGPGGGNHFTPINTIENKHNTADRKYEGILKNSKSSPKNAKLLGWNLNKT